MEDDWGLTMYYGLEAFDDFTGLGAAASPDKCAKIQAKIDTLKSKQKAGGTVAQMNSWEKQITNQTKQLDKCLTSAGLPSAGTAPVDVAETGEVAAASQKLLQSAKKAVGKISGEDLQKAVQAIGSGQMTPEVEAMVKKAMGLPEDTREGAEVDFSAPRSGELIWGIPKNVVYIIGGVMGVGIVLTLLMQKRGGSAGAAPSVPGVAGIPGVSSAGGAK